ncbi:exonuclease domain-containing protein [Anaeromyxobacter sp. SG66]|uniref:exonuclease domain-containing protein n=1 Tax=Anaeromyxobacter sp. SG66 TaxID=2925410 RepID=UPI001F594D1A|nr:exonuclease domain-containing protein [Anaeromyxobacter sp. SG66]
MSADVFVALDVETANADRASICQVGAVVFEGSRLAHEWVSLVNPLDDFDSFNVDIHGIDEDAVRDAPTFQQIGPELTNLLSGRIVVSHTTFDRVAVTRAYEKAAIESPPCTWLDSARVARRTWSDVARSGFGLSSLAERIGYVYRAHDALEDAKAAAMVFLAAVADSRLDAAGWVERLQHCGSTSSQVTLAGAVDGPLFGEVVVFTGALSIARREAAEMAARIGCEVAPGVTKKTTMIVVGDRDARGGEKTSKMVRAEQLIADGQPIELLTESDFVRLVEQYVGEEVPA